MDTVTKMHIPSRYWLAKIAPGSRIFRRILSINQEHAHCISMPLRFIRTFSVPSSTRYRFLDYARYHWTTHTKHVEIGGQLWDKFTRLALTSNETWKLHPWTTGDRSQLSQLRAMFGWAVKEHHLPLFRLALQFESHIQKICDLPLVGEGLPALHFACKQGHDEIVSQLLAFCNNNKPDQNGSTPLHYAVARGHINVVNILLNQKNVTVHLSPNILEPLLLLATSTGHTDIANNLIEHGAPIEAQNAWSGTSLIVAAAAVHVSTMELLQGGANVEAKDNGKQSARLRAFGNRHWEIVSGLLDFELREGIYEIESVLLSGIQDDEPKLVYLFIGKGLNPNSTFFTHKPSDGHSSGTVLTWAARKGYVTLVQVLINNGADISLRDDSGCTPLTWAARGGHATIVQVLIDNGADINLQDDAGCTPLSRAAEFNHKGTVTLLIACGAEINFPFNNYAPLQIASIRGNKEIKELLLKHGARWTPSIEERDHKGRTPLLLAVEEGNNKRVKLLIDHGASLDTRDHASRTPLMQAAEKGNEAVVETLLRCGANHELRDADGVDALGLAIKNGHFTVADLLLDSFKKVS